MRPFGDAHQLRWNLVGLGPRTVLPHGTKVLGAHAKPDAVSEQASREIGPGDFMILKLEAAGVAARIERQNFRFEQVRDAQQPRNLHAGGLFQDLARRAALHDAALAQDQHLLGQLEALVQIVRDQQNGDLELRPDLRAAVSTVQRGAAHPGRAPARPATEAGETPINARAIEQRCFWPPETSCGRRPATSVRWKRSSISLTRRCRSRRGMPVGGEHQVLPQRHVREQRVVLKDVAAMPLLRAQVHAGCGVEQNLVVEQNAPGIRAARSLQWNRASASCRRRSGRTAP